MNCLTRALSTKKPDIINSDQGSHFTNPKYIALLESENVRILMDGKGQALDNVRTERFFRSITYDKTYINEYDTPKQLRQDIDQYRYEYNTYRLRSSIGNFCTMEVHCGKILKIA